MEYQINGVVAEAYPTIPIVFVSSVRDNRLPIHNSMGLSITDKQNETRVETKLAVTDTGQIDSFILNGKELQKERIDIFTRDCRRPHCDSICIRWQAHC